MFSVISKFYIMLYANILFSVIGEFLMHLVRKFCFFFLCFLFWCVHIFTSIRHSLFAFF